MRRSAMQFLMFLISSVFATTVSATLAQPTWDYFPLPAKTQRTEVQCSAAAPTKCTLTYINAPTVGYDGAITTHVGRMLDATNVIDWQSIMRTMRSYQFHLDKAHNRLYIRYGSTIAIYDVPTMMTRLASGAMSVADTSKRRTANGSGNKGEKYLAWDNYFYPETDQDWLRVGAIVHIDGQDRLVDFDVDDRGYVYVASTVYGWGILHDTRSNNGSAIPTVVPMYEKSNITPGAIVSIHSVDTNRYYALVAASSDSTSEVWDVTDPTTPTRIRTINHGIAGTNSYVKSDDQRWVALVEAGQLYITSPEALISNASPAYTARPLGGAFRAVATDGTNFYTAQIVGGLLTVSKFINNNGSFSRIDIPTGVPMGFSTTLTYNDGYLTVMGTDDLEVFRVTGATLTRLDLKAYGSTNLGADTRFFNRYYVKCSTATCAQGVPSGYLAPDIINFVDGMVFKYAGKTYLLASLVNLADVYEIKGSDGVAAANKGVAGSVNPYAATPSGSAPFYGDRITFGSTTTAPAPMNVLWNFGNPESPSDNTTASTTGADVQHQYSGLTSVSQIGARTVSVTNATDSSINDTLTLNLQVPAARVRVLGTNTVIAQANSTSSAPIVTSDKFVDASDGSVEGHFSTWTIGGTPTLAIPTAPVPVGSCGAQTLGFVANYGPYAGTGSTLHAINGSVPVSLGSIRYTVQPFVAIINPPTSNATAITFTSGSRVSTDTSVIPAGMSFHYQWDLLNSSSTSVQTASGDVTSLSGLQFVVPRATFTGLVGAKVRLRISAAANSLPAACQTYATSEALTAALSAPDPKITVSTGCQYAGSPCTITVNSASGADMSGWTLNWSVNGPAAVSGATTKDFSPSFTATGSYTVQLTATNAIGSGSDLTTLSIAAAPCANPPAAADISLSYGNTNSSCGMGSTCAVGEKITFKVFTFGKYNFNSTCDKYVWDFGDGQTSNVLIPTHSYTANKTYNGSFKLTVGTNPTVTVPFTVTIGTSGGTGGTGGGGTGGGGCPQLTSSFVFISFFANGSQCSSNVNTACAAGEQIAFTANPLGGYNFGCGLHTFAWDFGDGQIGSGQTLNHAYVNAGSYTAHLTVVGPSGSANVTVPVTVGGGSTGGGCTIPSASNMIIALNGATSHCTSTAPSCTANETITMTVTALGNYNFNCGAHTYTWDFGDGSAPLTGASQQVTHAFSGSQTQYTVHVTVANPAGSAQLAQGLRIGSPSTGGGNCASPAGGNVFLTYTGPNSGCSYTVNKSCSNSEAINFSVAPNTFNGYSFSCGPHTFAWTFGDGTTSSAQSPTHTFATPGTYNVSCVVTNGSGSVTLPATISVAQGTGGTGQPTSIGFTGSIVTGTIVNFVPTVSPAGSVTVWSWNFGDGSPVVTVNSSTPTSQLHQYASTGTYTVTMTYGNATTPQLGQVQHSIVVGTPPPPRRRSGRH